MRIFNQISHEMFEMFEMFDVCLNVKVSLTIWLVERMKNFKSIHHFVSNWRLITKYENTKNISFFHWKFVDNLSRKRK